MGPAVALALVFGCMGSLGCATGTIDESDSRTTNGVTLPTSGGSEGTTEASSGTGTSGGTSTSDTTTSAGESTSTGEGTETATTEMATGTTTGESTTTGAPVGCGDGLVDGDELCDDGNQVDGDGCNADCRPSGELLWSDQIGSGLGKDDDGFDVAVDGFANLYVTGYVSTEAAGRDVWIRKYDELGDELWTQTYDGSASGSDQGRGIVVEDSELFYVGGLTAVELASSNTWLRRHGADGSTLWTKTYDGPVMGSDIIRALAKGPGNQVLAVGHHSVGEGMQDVWMRRYSDTGSVLWTRTYSGAALGNDQGEAAVFAPDGSIYVVGNETVAGEGYNMWLSKLDADGNILWTRQRNGPSNKGDYLRGVTVDPSGDVIVCGYEGMVDIPWQSWVRRYDADGIIVWTDVYSGETEEGAHCFGIERDLDGDYVMTGGENVDGVRRVMIRKLSPEGEPRWARTIEPVSVGPDFGREVAIGPDNSIYVGGSVISVDDARDIWVGRLSP